MKILKKTCGSLLLCHATATAARFTPSTNVKLMEFPIFWAAATPLWSPGLFSVPVIEARPPPPPPYPPEILWAERGTVPLSTVYGTRLPSVATRPGLHDRSSTTAGDGKAPSSPRRIAGRSGAPDMRLLRQLGTVAFALRRFPLRVLPR